MNLSPHFTLAEMTYSGAAIKNKLDNTPDAATVANLRMTCATLEEVRALLARPISVSSGYRAPAVNIAVGGTEKSDHCKGLAADITVAGLSALEVCRLIRDSDIQFSQLIYEGTWTHIAVAPGRMKRQLLTAHFSAGRTTYSPGIA